MVAYLAPTHSYVRQPTCDNSSQFEEGCSCTYDALTDWLTDWLGNSQVLHMAWDGGSFQLAHLLPELQSTDYSHWPLSLLIHIQCKIWIEEKLESWLEIEKDLEPPSFRMSQSSLGVKAIDLLAGGVPEMLTWSSNHHWLCKKWVIEIFTCFERHN